jgi:hypothetical protein
MKKKHKNIIALLVIAIIIYYLYHTMMIIPTRHDRTLISDLSKTKKILITLSRYDYICFSIKAKDQNQELEFKNLELIIKEPDGKTVFSTQEYKTHNDEHFKDSVRFRPHFFSASQASPCIHGPRVMVLYLKPEVPFELEIKYQEKDNKNTFKGASLEMMASSKAAYDCSDKHFSVKPINDK